MEEKKQAAQKARDLESLQEFTKDSTVTEEDALRLGKEVRKGVVKKIRERR